MFIVRDSGRRAAAVEVAAEFKMDEVSNEGEEEVEEDEEEEVEPE